MHPQTDEQLLATSSAWDYIQHHELHKRGLVDLSDIVGNLKQRVQFDGAGPVFAENGVEQDRIEDDELI